jgi:hypothetical protein
MATQIDQDATSILSLLAGAPRNEYVTAAEIARKADLPPNRVNDAVALLVEAAFAEWLQTMGTAPFDFGEAMITPRGRREAQRITAEAATDRPESESPSSQEGAAIQLFISHASDDVELARRLVVLVSAALRLPATTIRCTSVDGYRLPAGANTSEQLRLEVHDSASFIGIVSHASIRSMYVLFELGARWGAGKNLIPLMAHGVPMSILGGPLAGLNALRADAGAQLHQLVSDLGEQLAIKPQSPAVFDHALHDVLQLSPSSSKDSIASASRPSSVVATAARSKMEVRQHHSEIDETTGTSVALLHLSADRSARLKIRLPGKEPEEFRDITAGHVWNFYSQGTRYRMLLTQVDYPASSVILDIRKDEDSA